MENAEDSNSEKLICFSFSETIKEKLMQQIFTNHTEYTLAEDLKRLRFITTLITEHLPPGSKILDVGCGTGNNAYQLAQMGYTVKGIDPDSDSIAYAREKFKHPNLRYELNDANSMDSENDVYDGIVCSEVLEHLDHPENLVKSIKKLLRPEGIFAATVPNGYGPRELFVTRIMLFLHYKMPGIRKAVDHLKKTLGYSGTTTQSKAEHLEHKHFFSKNAITRLISGNGFELIKFSNANFIEATFPISLITNRILVLKEWDCRLADYLPHHLTSGFYMGWRGS
jgi:ubiquinone/menaquinone biosynthesis C-methylase UbiE